MGVYGERILPRIVDTVMGSSSMGATRAQLLRDLDGEVLEIGFGTGHNLPHYPAAVTEIHAIEPSTRSIELAAARTDASPARVVHVGTDAQRLDLPDGRYRNVVSTWTLCTIPDVASALAEIARVLAPGGTFRFVEHGHCPDPRVARWQQRIEPLWKRVGGGCHLSREIDRLITDAGLQLTSIRNYAHNGDPRITSWTYEGTATHR